EMIRKHQPPIVITSLGDPGPVVEVVHHYDGLVLSDVINPFFAKKAYEIGADGLILVSSGAGGHGGTLNPFAFVNVVRKFFDGTIVLAVNFSKGYDIMTADVICVYFAYINSRFISVDESGAEEKYQDIVIDSDIDDIIYTEDISGINGNYLIPSKEQ